MQIFILLSLFFINSFIPINACVAKKWDGAPYRKHSPRQVVVDNGATLDVAMEQNPVKYFKQLMVQADSDKDVFANASQVSLDDFLFYSLTVLRDLKGKKPHEYAECYNFAMRCSLNRKPTFKPAYPWWNKEKFPKSSYIDQLQSDDPQTFDVFAKKESALIQQSLKENPTLKGVDALKRFYSVPTLKVQGEAQAAAKK